MCILGINFLSFGSALPEGVVTNDDLSHMVETNDEWIYTRTGIKQRHVAINETTVSLGTYAAEKAISKAGIDKNEIDLVVCATITPDTSFPSTAGMVRQKIGLRDIPALDVCGVACAGFIYAASVAQGLMATGGYKTALVLGAETLSKITDWSDRSSCILFGDGAGAAILRSGDGNGIITYNLDGINDVDEYLICRYPASDSPFYKGEQVDYTKMKMNGNKVFTFGINSVIGGVTEMLSRSGLTADDIKWIVPHQANYRIISSAAHRLNIPVEKFYVNIDHVGNTSSASIPIALDEMTDQGLVQKGDKIILVGFGGGLAAGSMLIEL